MTTKRNAAAESDGMNIGNFGTFKSPDGDIERIANTAAEAVAFKFDGWQQTKDGQSSPETPAS